MEGERGKEVGECAKVEVSAMSYIGPHVQVKVEGEERGEHILHTLVCSMVISTVQRPLICIQTDMFYCSDGIAHCKVHSHTG